MYWLCPSPVYFLISSNIINTSQRQLAGQGTSLSHVDCGKNTFKGCKNREGHGEEDMWPRVQTPSTSFRHSNIPLSGYSVHFCIFRRKPAV